MLQTRNLLLNLFIVLPAPGQAPPVTVFNDSEAVWLLVNAYPQIVPRSPATSVRIQTLTRQGQTESPPQIHIDRLEVPIPARSELIIQLLDPIFPYDPSSEGILFYLEDRAGQRPGTTAHLIYHFPELLGPDKKANAGAESTQTILCYWSPMAQDRDEDAVVVRDSTTAVRIKADSWEPVLEERRRARTWIDRLLGLW